MRFPTIKDGRGNNSTTLFFVAVTWVVVLVKFILAGTGVPFVGADPMAVTDFAQATLLVLGLWVGREGLQKNVELKRDSKDD